MIVLAIIGDKPAGSAVHVSREKNEALIERVERERMV